MATRTGPTPVRREAPLPLWAQVHEDLRRRLDASEFAESFPGEMELVEQYGVSRHTVREALRRLRTAGVVVAERGRRPRLVPRPVIDQPVGALYSLFAAVEAAGQVQHSVVRTLDTRSDPDVATRLGLPADAELLHLERLRLADDEPLALDCVWLPAETTRALLAVDFRHTGLYQELEARCGIRLSGGSERVRALVPSREERADLDLPPGVAVFVIDRHGEADGTPVECRRTLVRGDRVELTARFSPDVGYQLQPTSRTRP